MFNAALKALRGGADIPPNPGYSLQLLCHMFSGTLDRSEPDICSFTDVVQALTAAGDITGAQQIWNAVFFSSKLKPSEYRFNTGHETTSKESRKSLFAADGRLVPDGPAFEAGIVAFAQTPSTWSSALQLLVEAEEEVDRVMEVPAHSKKQVWRNVKRMCPRVPAYREVWTLLLPSPPPLIASS